MRRLSDSGAPARSRLPRLVGRRAREERRTVTVMFVDIEGFTRLCGELDPEDVRGLQIPYFRKVSGVVARWGGVVEKYVGDAVLAVFGAPRSDELDAYRAVRAGLEIHEALTDHRQPDGSPVQVRVGIATGEAVVDLDAARDAGQALLSGDVVNTAARLQTHAAAGTVVVTAATWRATAALIRYDDRRSIAVAGKPRGIAVWQARDMQPHGPVPSRRPVSPLVGRDGELSTLAGWLARAVGDREPQVIALSGPAGIGKSRLVRELAGRVGGSGGTPVRWWAAPCFPHGGDRFAPFAQMLRAYAGIGAGDDASTAGRKVAEALGELVAEVEVPRLLAALAGPLGLRGARPLGPRGARPERATARDVRWALRRVLLAAARRPLVLVVEDLHGADSAVARVVREVVGAAAAAALPLAVVVTTRAALPEALASLPGDRVRTMALHPLTDAATGELLRGLLRGSGLPAAFADRLRPAAGGNPRYAEEYVRMLERPAAAVPDPTGDGLPMPEPVRRIVSAQLDQIDEPDRGVLQAAAVLGDAIWPGAVAAMLAIDVRHAQAALRRLEVRGVLACRSTSSVTGQPEYAFGQRAVRDVAYDRLPRPVRADHHGRAARWLEAAGGPARSIMDEHRGRHRLAAYGLCRALRRDAGHHLAAAAEAFLAAARAAASEGDLCRAGELTARADRLRPAHTTDVRMRQLGPVSAMTPPEPEPPALVVRVAEPGVSHNCPQYTEAAPLRRRAPPGRGVAVYVPSNPRQERAVAESKAGGRSRRAGRLMPTPYRPRDDQVPIGVSELVHRHLVRATGSDPVLRRYRLVLRELGFLAAVLAVSGAFLALGVFAAVRLADLSPWTALGFGLGGAGTAVVTGRVRASRRRAREQRRASGDPRE